MKKIVLLFIVFLVNNLCAQKPALDHSVYDQWQSIRETQISNNGYFVAYVVSPQEGDGVLVFKNIASGKEVRINRGTEGKFTDNSNYFVAKIKPTFQETRAAKIAKKKPHEMPKDSLVLIHTASGQLTMIPSVKSFQIAKKGNTHIVYLKDKNIDISKTGADLILYDLQFKTEIGIPNILSYLINPIGSHVVLHQVANNQLPNKVLLSNFKDTVLHKLSTNFNSVNNFTWDEQGKQLAYFIERDSAHKLLQKEYELAHFNFTNDTALIMADKKSMGIPNGYTLGSDRKLNFSKTGNNLFFGIQPILPIKDTSMPEFDRVSIDIWHYAEPILQSAQIKSLETSLKSTELVVLNTHSNSIQYLGKIKEKDFLLTNEGDGNFIYYTSDSNTMIASQWQGASNKELYVRNVSNGKIKLIDTNWKGSVLLPSANGNRLIYYDEYRKSYKSFNAITGNIKIIAKDIKYALFDEENDVPDDPNAYGIVKWMDDHQHLIVYDRYDLWLVDAEGNEASIQLTNGRYRKKVFRFVNLDIEKRSFLKSDEILLRSFNELDKSESIEILNLNTHKLFIINKIPMHLSSFLLAQKASDLLIMQEDETNSPNWYHYQFNSIVQNPIALTSINPQQSNYNWLKSNLVKWKSYTGKTAEGILYLPENFDEKKKYPMIVYFYERNNQTLHYYLPPAPTPSRLNIPFFVSRGYLVFVPDIWYKKGFPGQGAYDYIVSGTRAMIQKGFVDSTKIGLQGQSWGGYQIAHLITKTNLYAAAWAGAPVVNMTSAYGGIRWGMGINRQFQYEKTQSRIGATLWERPDLYIKNSPLFELDKVKTPIVIMSNDADDAVPWYQGIEMFTAMRRLGKPIWMLVYNNEAHNLVERKNRKDIQIREQQFFDHYLKGDKMPIWMSKGVPAIMKGRDLGLGQ